ncbi:imidazole glycerol phosphate synthase, glutamine amidotransferase subunit [Candidatus Gottesmanbacteria bacterium RBG_16_37_8]|uniref:Imidazole glycerol phosphate synthase subunit HisH n=1 Tax=Candidatus Gottesmanbacteria bacterium RBG_16_37_8 TaxID=1798371 RepID=A0A1F5YUF9_9BACT|nr:MAG: imidazole glycerol phosphate synthase, glutamine amidotransferase subunit [Candidatus Gottesmanbacteria bacterium RBG_16_37_8]
MIGIIDYGIGNLGSVSNAIKKLSRDFLISDDPSRLLKAEILILPGVGSAREGMKNINKRKLDKFLFEEIKKGKPFLGICLGMQLLFEESEEGDVSCLGILKGKVKKFLIERKIPQIGWNQVRIKSHFLRDKAWAGNYESGIKNKLFTQIPDNSFFYFVNSFYCIPENKSIIAGETLYGEKFASIIVKNNIMATQFHPEKSGKVGFQLLSNFIRKFYVN